MEFPDAYCPECIGAFAFDILTWLGYTHSTLNPILYAVLERTVGDTVTILRSLITEDVVVTGQPRSRFLRNCLRSFRLSALKPKEPPLVEERHSPIPARPIDEEF